jgi:DNA-binding SARP family transcriptional activator
VTVTRLTILGPVRAWLGGDELDLGPPQQRGGRWGSWALNAGQPVSAGELIDALWGEQMPPGTPGMVRTYVYKLRQALGYEALKSSSAGYALAAGAVRIDLDGFCRLADQASALRASGALDPAAQRLREAMAL